MITEVSGEPYNRLTRVCDDAVKAMEANPEMLDTDKAIIFVTSEEYSGIVLHGYEDLNEAIPDLFVHLKAMFQAVGKDLDFIGIPESPEGIDG